MARGVRRPLGELIEEQQLLVDKKTEELKKAKARLKELQEQEQTEMMAAVVKIAKEKNMSVEDLLKSVK